MEITMDFHQLGEYLVLLGEYRWLLVETYIINNFDHLKYSRETLITALLGNKIYHHSYLTPKELEKSSDQHGPFQVAKLRPDNFKQITLEQFSIRIDTIFNSEFGFTPEDDSIDIARKTEARGLLNNMQKNKNTDYYELDLDRENESYHHEFWWVFTSFHEFIIFDHSSDKLILCILGGD